MGVQSNRGSARAGAARLAIVLLAASAVTAAGCGRDNPTITASSPSTSTRSPSGASATPGTSSAEGPACALLTPDDLAAFGDGYTEKVVQNGAVAKNTSACQWVGNGPVLNLFTFPSGKATASFDSFTSGWKAQGETVTPVPGIGDRAATLVQSGIGIRYLAVQVGDAGFRIDTNAPLDKLLPVATAAAGRL